jgi:hypothetical protein
VCDRRTGPSWPILDGSITVTLSVDQTAMDVAQSWASRRFPGLPHSALCMAFEIERSRKSCDSMRAILQEAGGDFSDPAFYIHRPIKSQHSPAHAVENPFKTRKSTEKPCDKAGNAKPRTWKTLTTCTRAPLVTDKMETKTVRSVLNTREQMPEPRGRWFTRVHLLLSCFLFR